MDRLEVPVDWAKKQCSKECPAQSTTFNVKVVPPY